MLMTLTLMCALTFHQGGPEPGTPVALYAVSPRDAYAYSVVVYEDLAALAEAAPGWLHFAETGRLGEPDETGIPMPCWTRAVVIGRRPVRVKGAEIDAYRVRVTAGAAKGLEAWAPGMMLHPDLHGPLGTDR
jgi:hypothetical protein